ncbi:MAG: glycosyltransferase [Patescibacteria group bacterium]
MERKNVLFVSSVKLDNPMRGTPLRIYKFILQIQKANNIWVCAQTGHKDFADNFFEIPKVNPFKKFLFFKKIIKDKKIGIVMSGTGTNIKLLVILKLLLGVKIVIDLHGLDFEEPYYHGYIDKKTMIMRKIMIKFFLRFYDLLFVVSGKLKDYYKDVNKNIEVIYGGVDLAEFQRAEYQNHDYLFIGYMGNARSYQGLDLLCRAAKNIKQKKLFPFKLNLVTSEDPEETRKLIRENDLEAETVMHHNIEHHLVNDIINQSDVLVLARPSGIMMTEYAYPAKLPEYLATGIVNILTNVGPVEELLLGKDVCLVIGTDDVVKELEESLYKVYKMSKEERMAMGDRAIEFVKNNLTWEIIGRKMNEYLAKLK